MNLFLNRQSAVPLHDQLCAQIGQLVASGSLLQGTRLPSVRGLASRLGIHHNTVQAVYRELAERGMLDVRQGSGVRVAAIDQKGQGAVPGATLAALASGFVAHARALGYDAPAIHAAVAGALTPAAVARLVVVNPHEDLQRLYVHELAERLALPMAGLTLAELASLPVALRDEACFLTSMNHAGAVRAALGDGARLVIFRLASLEPLLAQVRALPPDAVVALVSESARFLFLIGELLAGVLDADRLIRVPLTESRRVQQVARLASLLITDSGSATCLPGQGAPPVQVLRLLADDVFAELQALVAGGPVA